MVRKAKNAGCVQWLFSLKGSKLPSDLIGFGMLLAILNLVFSPPIRVIP